MKKTLYLSALGLSSWFLIGCGPATNAPTTPSASPSATAAPPSASPSAIASPSAPAATPTPSATGTPAASATPSLPQPTPAASESPAPINSPVPTPSPTPSADVYSYRDNFFKNYGVNPFVETATDRLSTFAADVDTASYTLMRKFLEQNKLPDPASIRTEEFLNFFNYHYSQPPSGKFAIHTDIAPSYFGDPQSNLLRVGLQGKEILARNRKPAVLTFVIDVSGSMNLQNRL
ncbi:MAG: von Willebrand factor type A domain-containing protein, partial [Candidatus Sericytochromatia bacterium]|nr:von Willebrand factor type A domain-containing protein [Candidatus Sericytochromatia bacterium]